MTYHQKKNWKSYCSEQLELVENYQQAKAEGFKGWCIHHRLEIQPDGTKMSKKQLIDKDIYYRRPANELVFMRFSEHTTLHMLGNIYMKGKQLSEETRNKLSEALRGRTLSEESCRKMSESHKGKHKSAEHRKKLSEARKGIHWWNNGIEMKMSRECPGEGWKRGRIKASMTNCKT